MLVLTRRANESIVIAEGEIEVTIIEVQHGKVRLGITAPKDIPIHRKEVQDAINRERSHGDVDP